MRGYCCESSAQGGYCMCLPDALARIEELEAMVDAAIKAGKSTLNYPHSKREAVAMILQTLEPVTQSEQSDA